MSNTATKSAPKRRSRQNEPISFNLPPLPSLLTQPLGLEGWARFEPVLIAALVTEEPMLLIGPHGSAKSFMLERLAEVLEMDYRFYNASLINYDDLVGIPMPDEQRKSLRYISTATAIWDAQIVFVDEINRTRPELQNKLFPIVHERRVQGIQLEKLRYRWAAMNPAPSAEAADEEADVYFGAEPLDPALADRFSFVIEVPGWQQLSEEEKRSILRDQFTGKHPFGTSPEQLIGFARQRYEELKSDPPRAIEDYLILLVSALETQRLACSARRVTMLHRNILAVHAARVAMYNAAWPDVPSQVIDWNTSALVALNHSLPQIAQGRKPDPAALLAAHRQAWEVTRIDENNPWRRLLGISDPVERCITAIQMADDMSDDDLSQVILDALASQSDIGERVPAALAIYLAMHRKRGLRAAVYETLARDVRCVLRPREGEETPSDGTVRLRCRKARDLAAKLRSEANNGSTARNHYAANLVLGLIPDAYEEHTPHQVCARFLDMWDRLNVQMRY